MILGMKISPKIKQQIWLEYQNIVTSLKSNLRRLYSSFSTVPILSPSSQNIEPWASLCSSRATIKPNGFVRLSKEHKKEEKNIRILIYSKNGNDENDKKWITIFLSQTLRTISALYWTKNSRKIDLHVWTYSLKQAKD